MDQVNAVADSLKNLKISYQIQAVKNIKHLTEILNEKKQKIIFNLVEEFDCGIKQACLVPEVINSFGKACTGNSTDALLISQDKIKTKAIFGAYNLPCPAGAAFNNLQQLLELKKMNGKYIIKPALTDASEGITADSVVSLPKEQSKANKIIENILMDFEQPVLVEQFIPSRELNVSVLEIDNKPKVLAVAEIDFSAFDEKRHKIVDYNAKWQSNSFEFNNTPRKIPAELPNKIYKKIENLALSAFEIMCCNDYVRVDFRLDEKDNPYLLEINPNPDISPDAGFAAALEYAKIEYKDFVKIVIQNTKVRLAGK